MSRPITHVVTSPSFVNFIASVFNEAAPDQNLILALGVEPDRLTGTDVPVEFIEPDRSGMRRVHQRVASSRVAVYHNVTPVVAGVLARTPPTPLRVWSGWGGDYYGTTFDYHAGQLGPRTRLLVNRTRPLRSLAGKVLHTVQHARTLRAAARAADVFSAPIPEDFKVFTRRFRDFTGRYSQLNYASVENSLTTGAETRRLGPDVLVGNSAAPVNNHLEMFDVLARLDLTGRKVIVPLSYGNSEYARTITRAGEKLLGVHFEPVTDFLTIHDYNTLLSRCGVVVMGHRRQGGMGNILRALWQGAQVVLDPRNPVFAHLESRGVAVTPIDELCRFGVPRGQLSTRHLEANRAHLREHWSRDTVVNNVKTLLSLAD